MAQASWHGAIIADTESFEELEGNLYFPPEAIRETHLEPSETRTRCPWKGEAHYFTLVVNGKRNPDAAWTYPDPKPAAARIRGHIAFWRGVEMTR